MKSVELFAGAGGLALGVAQAGFDHEVVLEWDRNACDTLRRNHDAGVAHVSSWRIVEGDVCDYDFTQHSGRVQFVAGGPPCQPFSLGGKHLGQHDKRNMFPQAVRAVSEIAPKAFIFENVKGLLRQNFSNYYSYIIHQLSFPEVRRRGDEEWIDHLARLEKLATRGSHSGLSYNVIYQLLDAADYGVPQRRHRVFIVGIRSDLGLEFNFPLATHTEDGLLFEQWISGEYWDRHRVSKLQRPRLCSRLKHRVDRLRDCLPEMLGLPWRTVRDAISDLPRLCEGQTCKMTANHFLNPGARVYAGHNGSPLDLPAKALKAGDHGVPGGENTLRFADGTVRYFSVRECARIQTFPDDWVFEGSWTESMRQLGNAVPVVLSNVVARELAGALRLKGITRLQQA
ncbi:MAG: DNA cytosine methyltransferase [Planctomycetes bacterium]|nr:DNA cytosine methyltransferase [Planctomycetota bacterium]